MDSFVCMCLQMCLSICLSVCLSVCLKMQACFCILYLFVRVCLYACIPWVSCHACVCVCVCVCVYTLGFLPCLCLCLCVCVFVFVRVCDVCVCMRVYLGFLAMPVLMFVRFQQYIQYLLILLFRQTLLFNNGAGQVL